MIRRLLLPSQRMLRGLSGSLRPSGQSPCHTFWQKAISERHQHPRKMRQELMVPSSSWESSRVTAQGFATPECPQKTWHKKRENPGRRESFGRSGWKGGKSSHNEALTTAAAPFSCSLSDGFNKGAHSTICQPTQFLQRQLDQLEKCQMTPVLQTPQL